MQDMTATRRENLLPLVLRWRFGTTHAL